MKEKMEDIARELQEETEELFAFVEQRFMEIVERLGKPKPKIPESDTSVVFFLKAKAFVKTLLGSERKDGKLVAGNHLEHKGSEVPHSKLCGITLIIKHPTNEKKKFVNILINCARIRRDASKLRIGLKQFTTSVLIHEMIHNMEILTGICILKSPFFWEDGYTIPIYEAWRRRK